MFHWLYSQAKQFKKIQAKQFKKMFFALGGIAVGVSTGTALLSSTAGWIANLVAVGCVGLYSIFKNMETTHFITTQKEKIKQIAMRLSLQQYPGTQALIRPHLRAVFDKIIVPHHEMDRHEVDIIMEEIERVNAKTSNPVSGSRWQHRIANPIAQDYAILNAIAQTLFGAMSIIVNIKANLENSKETKSDPQTAKTLSYLNLVVAIVCISSQYLIHMYVARNLRPMATDAQNGESILSNAQDSVFFRAVEMTVEKCNRQITEITAEQEGIKKKLELLEEELKEKKFLKTKEEGEDSSTQIPDKIVELQKSLANQEALLFHYQQLFKNLFKNLPERIQQSENQLVRVFFEPRKIEIAEAEEFEEPTVRRSFEPSFSTMEEE